MNPATHTHTSTPAHSQPTTSCAGRVRAFDDGDRDAALALEVAPNPAATGAFLRAQIAKLNNHSNAGEIDRLAPGAHRITVAA